VSKKELVKRCTALRGNSKRNKRSNLLFLVLVPSLTLIFAGGLTPFVFITWLAGLLFAIWIVGALGGDTSEPDCKHFLPCLYDCPLDYPDWCPNKNRPERLEKSPYEIMD